MTEMINSNEFQDPPVQSVESSKNEKMEKERAKMQRQFEAVPFLIFLYVGQIVTMFLHMVFLFNSVKNSHEENIIGWFVVGIFYIFYINSISNFVKSFYNIMKNSKIDDSDLVTIEIWITFAFGTLLMIYGLTYLTFLYTDYKRYFGMTGVAIGSMIYIQCLLMRKFYIVAGINQKDDEDQMTKTKFD